MAGGRVVPSADVCGDAVEILRGPAGDGADRRNDSWDSVPAVLPRDHAGVGGKIAQHEVDDAGVSSIAPSLWPVLRGPAFDEILG